MIEKDKGKLSDDSSVHTRFLNTAPKDTTSDILRFFQILLIHKWKFLLIFFSILSLIVFYGLNKPKYYSSTYEVFYNESIKEFVIESEVPVIKTTFDKSFWLSTMRSDEIARAVALNTALPYSAATLRKMMKIEMAEVRGSIIPIFHVSVSSRNSTDIPIIINGFIISLNDLLIKNQIDNSERLIQFLSRQIEDNNKKLAAIDRQILAGGNDNSNTVRDFSKMATELENFRTSLLNSQIELSSVKAARKRTEVELLNLDGTIVNESAYSEPLKVQLMNLQVDLARALTQNREEHPTVRSIRDNIEQINIMLRDSIQQQLEIKNLIQNPLKGQLMSKLMDLKLNEISLETRVLSLMSVISDYELKILPDTTDNQQSNYRNRELIYITINLLNSRLIEAQSAAHGSLSRFVLVDDPAIPNVPSNRSWIFFFVLGICAGLVSAIVAITVYDMIDNRLMVINDYEKFFKVPLIGGVMHDNKLERDYYQLFEPEQAAVKLSDFSEIVVNIKHIIKNNNSKLFSICSPLRGEGKSLISLYIASSLAQRGYKVLLADIDFYGPRLTKKMGNDQNFGLTDFLTGDVSIESLFNSTSLPNLSFTPAGRTTQPSRFSYDNEVFRQFIERANHMYDVVILDTPAVLFIPDVLSFMDFVDSVIIVARMRFTTRSSLYKLIKMMGENKSKIDGTILNDIKKSSTSKYSNYYKYDYKYSHYPEDVKV